MYLRKRVETLEASLAPRGEPIVFWAMVGDRPMTDAEIEAETAILQAGDPSAPIVPVSWL